MKTRKIFQAIRRRDPADLSKLLAKGHHPGRRPGDSDSPLGQAAEYSTPEIVRLLLEAGAPVEEYEHDGYSSLCRAAYDRCDDEGRLEIVRLLVDAGADMGRISCSFSVLYLAVKGRRYDVIRFLLERGCPLFPLSAMQEIQDPSFLVWHLAENPRFQRYLHEKFSDALATQSNPGLYQTYYEKVPFERDPVREKEVQAKALQRRIEEQRRYRQIEQGGAA